MLYIKNETIVSSKQKVLLTEDKQIINPREEDFIEAGYIEYIPPVEEISEEEINNI